MAVAVVAGSREGWLRWWRLVAGMRVGQGQALGSISMVLKGGEDGAVVLGGHFWGSTMFRGWLRGARFFRYYCGVVAPFGAGISISFFTAEDAERAEGIGRICESWRDGGLSGFF